MRKFGSRDGAGPAFSGLWICPDIYARDQATFRSAILFLESDGVNYMLRFNHDAIEDGMTMEFIWDYRATPRAIFEHPLNYPESIQIEVPWKRGDDSSLMLEFDIGWQRFHPAKFQQLFEAGFEKDYVEDIVRQLADAGWHYRLEPGFPRFGALDRSTEPS